MTAFIHLVNHRIHEPTAAANQQYYHFFCRPRLKSHHFSINKIKEKKPKLLPIHIVSPFDVSCKKTDKGNSMMKSIVKEKLVSHYLKYSQHLSIRCFFTENYSENVQVFGMVFFLKQLPYSNILSTNSQYTYSLFFVTFI